MGTKLKPDLFDCEGKALPDEPKFTLLGRDRVGPDAVRVWVGARLGVFRNPPVEKIRHLIAVTVLPDEERAQLLEALDCADAMEQWRIAHDGAWRMVPGTQERQGKLVREAAPGVFVCVACGVDLGGGHPEVAACEVYGLLDTLRRQGLA